MADSAEVTVVLPAYNEEATIREAVATTLAALEEFLPSDAFEVIIAEDGCTDRTPEIAAQLQAEDNRVRHVHSDERLGRGRALRNAFSAADGQVLAYFDTDLATDLQHLEELIETVRSGAAPIAVGSRQVPGHTVPRPASRGILSRAYNQLVRLLLGSSVHDHQCGFKAFDRDVLFSLLPEVGDDHWFWDTEVLVRAQRSGYQVHEFPVDWTPRDDTKVDFIRDVLGMGSQIIRTWWQLSINPKITRRRSVIAGVLLTVVAIALMSLYLDFGQVIGYLEGADPRLVGLAALSYLLSWPLRGARYRDILADLGYPDSISFLTGAVFISQTGNLVLPARAGDGVRAYIMKTQRAVPYPSGFASLAVERVFDLLTITVIAGTMLLGLTASGWSAQLPELAGNADRAGRTAITVAGAVAMIAILVVFVILLSARSTQNRIRRVIDMLSDDSYAKEVATVIERFVGDIQAVTASPRSFIRIGVGSVLIWVFDVITATIVFLAFPGTELSIPVLFVVCLFAVSVGNLAKVLPLSPGGIGLYEGAFTLLVVGVTGLPWQLALGAAIVDHAVKNIITVIGGVVSMSIFNVSLMTAIDEGQEATPAEAD